jgi:hypothetical protein
MPFRPEYRICPGDRLEVEVVQPDGGRALVVGKLDAVPKVAGGCAVRIVVCDAQISCCLPGSSAPADPLALSSLLVRAVC